MRKEIRTICYDNDLDLEAYRLEGIVQPFPNHFHEYFVIGYMLSGERYLSCKNKEYTLHQGDIVLFNPEDNHACAQSGSNPLHYLGINISKPVMQRLVTEITGAQTLPYFSQTVVTDDEVACHLAPFHERVMSGSGEFEKEELLLFMLSLLLQRYSKPFFENAADCREEIESTCRLIEARFSEPITLEQLCNHAGLSKSGLLRAFTKSKGMTPYRYLQTVRIGAAKKMLERDLALIDVSLQTGFSDQSHFTRFFTMFIGLAPGVYRDIFREKHAKALADDKGFNP